MIGGVTRLGGFPGLPGRVTLSAWVTICHVNVQGGVTRLAGVAFIANSSKVKHVCFKSLHISYPSHGKSHQKPQRTHKECKNVHISEYLAL